MPYDSPPEPERSGRAGRDAENLATIKLTTAEILFLFRDLQLSDPVGFTILIYTLAIVIAAGPLDQHPKRLALAIEGLKEQVASMQGPADEGSTP